MHTKPGPFFPLWATLELSRIGCPQSPPQAPKVRVPALTVEFCPLSSLDAGVAERTQGWRCHPRSGAEVLRPRDPGRRAAGARGAPLASTCRAAEPRLSPLLLPRLPARTAPARRGARAGPRRIQLWHRRPSHPPCSRPLHGDEPPASFLLLWDAQLPVSPAGSLFTNMGRGARGGLGRGTDEKQHK